MFMQRWIGAAGAIAVALIFAGATASAQTTLRLGKAQANQFAFVPADVGADTGIFKKHGIDIEINSFTGDAKLQQAMASDSIDMALGSGPALAFIVKGSPIKGVAAMAGPPLLLAIVVRPDGAKSVAELKDKKISVSTAGGLTYWLVSETSRRKGWGPHGIDIQPMGAMAPQLAALKRGDIDGIVMDMSNAFALEKIGEGRILVRFNDLTDFIVHVIYASDKLIASRPEAIRGFLRGWFTTIAFMRKNKAETVAIAKDVIDKDEAVVSRTYDEVMPMYSDDGRFKASALAVLARSFVELGTLPAEPDMSKLYTEAFLSAK